MTFANTEKPNTYDTRRVEFLSLPTGPTKVRILDKEAIMKYTHFVGGVSVACLGEDCPICKNNSEIIIKDKENFRKAPGYLPRTRRYFVNVLDKSLTKICPKCGKEVKQDVAACPDCSTMLNDVERKPLNKVKVLAKGVTLFEQLNAIDANVVNQVGDPIGLNNYDVTIITTGTGKEVNYTVIPDASGNYSEEVVDASLKYDVNSCIITVNPEEMLDLFRGIKIRDIMLMRSKPEETEKETQPAVELSEDELKTIQDDLNNLFNPEK